MNTFPASTKQVAYLARLVSERPGCAISVPDYLTSRQASALIDQVLSIPRTPRVDVASTPAGALTLNEVEIGAYWTTADGIARVRKSRSSDRLYAEVLRLIDVYDPETGERAIDERTGEPKVKGKFDYTRGAIFNLARRMTVEEARAFGARHSICCACGASLSANKSVDAGIGPVCIKKI